MAPITGPRTHRERGAVLVEFALVLPLLLVVIAGIVDFAFVFQRYEVVTNAAREGSRMCALPGYIGNTPLVQARVREYIRTGLNLSTATLNTAVPTSSVVVTPVTIPLVVGGNTVNVGGCRVNVTYNHNYLILGPVLGLIGGSWASTVNLTASSTMRLEAGGAGS
jgi:Flp pilus assembly protein TadG